MTEIHAAEKKLRMKPSTVEEFVDIASFYEVGVYNSTTVLFFMDMLLKKLT